MVLSLFNSCKWIISYGEVNLKKVDDFYVLTWLIFAGPVTYTYIYRNITIIELFGLIPVTLLQHL